MFRRHYSELVAEPMLQVAKVTLCWVYYRTRCALRLCDTVCGLVSGPRPGGQDLLNGSQNLKTEDKRQSSTYFLESA